MFKKLVGFLLTIHFFFYSNAFSAPKEKQYQVISFFFNDPKGITDKFLIFMKFASESSAIESVKKLQKTIDEHEMLSFIFENDEYNEFISFQIYKSKYNEQKYYGQYYKLILDSKFETKHDCHKTNITKLDLSARINKCYLSPAHYFSLVEKPTVIGPKSIAELLEYGFDFIDRTTSLRHRSR